jgi:hypothetical protein
MKINVRIDNDLLKQLTNVNNERKIYIHPNPLTRDILWKRLERVFRYAVKYAKNDFKILDFAGGGVFFNHFPVFLIMLS